MLSILIPTYNQYVEALVRELHRQASGSGRPFEIIVSDDGSGRVYLDVNSRIRELPHVAYIRQERNLKRSGNRNFLGRSARYDYLLFIDCDARVVHDDFIDKYLVWCTGKPVVCGGTLYTDDPPEDRELFLRWFYGWKREVRSAETRSKAPAASFSSFNFIIERSLFLKNQFPEEITEYGHEDTIFGLSLGDKGIEINHIDNPLIHLGLETSVVFLEKSLSALRNMKKLMGSSQYGRFVKTIRVARYYEFCKKTGLSRLIRWLYPLIKKPFERNLTGRRPDLLYLDLYKLGYLLSLD